MAPLLLSKFARAIAFLVAEMELNAVHVLNEEREKGTDRRCQVSAKKIPVVKLSADQTAKEKLPFFLEWKALRTSYSVPLIIN